MYFQIPVTYLLCKHAYNCTVYRPLLCLYNNLQSPHKAQHESRRISDSSLSKKGNVGYSPSLGGSNKGVDLKSNNSLLWCELVNMSYRWTCKRPLSERGYGSRRKRTSTQKTHIKTRVHKLIENKTSSEFIFIGKLTSRYKQPPSILILTYRNYS